MRSRRGHISLYGWMILAAFNIAAAGCAQPMPVSAPPAGALFYYPTELVAPLDATGALHSNAVYIVSANFDQRFDTGWVTQVDVTALHNAIVANGSGPIFDVGRNALRVALKVPKLGGRLAMSPEGRHLFMPSRGSGLLTAMDIAEDGSITCGHAHDSTLSVELQRTDCDGAHLYNLVNLSLGWANRVAQNGNFRDYQDPFSVAVLPAATGNGAYVGVGYLSSGWVSVLGLQSGSNSGQLTLARNINIGPGTLESLTPNPTLPGHLTGTSRRFGTSVDISTLYDVDVTTSLAQGADVVRRTGVATDAGGVDIINVAYEPSGNHLYVTNRNPDSVVALEIFTMPTTQRYPGQRSAPEYNVSPQMMRVKSAVAIDSSLPTDIVYLPRPNGNLVAVASLMQDAIDFFSADGGVVQQVLRLPLAQLQGADGQSVGGQGPFGLFRVFRPGQFDYLFVTTFFDHGLSVIDISSPSIAGFRELTHISESPNFGNAPRSR